MTKVANMTNEVTRVTNELSILIEEDYVDALEFVELMPSTVREALLEALEEYSNNEIAESELDFED